MRPTLRNRFLTFAIQYKNRSIIIDTYIQKINEDHECFLQKKKLT